MKWFLLLTKRNFKKLSFVFILLLIPAITLAMGLTTQKDSSMLRIGYTCTGKPTESTQQVFDALKSDDGMLSFKYYDSIEDGMFAIEQADIDSLWIFEVDMEKSINDYFMSNGAPVVKVLNRTETEVSDLAREKLFCFIYPHISYAMFKDYMKESVPGGDKLTEEELRYYYEYKGIDTDIVEFAAIGNTISDKPTKSNHLTAPLRGIIAVIVMLAGCASAMFTLNDAKRGMYAIFSNTKRVSLYCTSLLSSLVPASVTAIIAMWLAGLIENPLIELVKMILFVAACTALALALMGIFKTSKALAVCVPLLTISSAIFSPVFMNAKFAPAIQILFPTYHYLYAISDSKFLLYLVLYTLIFGAIGYFTSKKI